MNRRDLKKNLNFLPYSKKRRNTALKLPRATTVAQTNCRNCILISKKQCEDIKKSFNDDLICYHKLTKKGPYYGFVNFPGPYYPFVNFPVENDTLSYS